MQETVGKAAFNEAIFGIKSKQPDEAVQSMSKTKKNAQKRAKRKGRLLKEDSDDDDAPPIEMSSKYPVPFLGTPRLTYQQRQQQRARDPRFDNRCGDYSSAKFRQNFNFVFEMKEQEVAQLKRQLKEAENPEEAGKIKYVLERATNQLREHKKQKEKIAKSLEEKQEAEKAVSEGRRPQYMKRSEQRMAKLVERYAELKKSGGLQKHLERHRKKQTGQAWKKVNM